MNDVVVTIGPEHTLRQAASVMSQRRVGAAVVLDPDSAGIGILTERDILRAVGAGLDPDTERASAHLTADIVFAAPGWSLEEAATAMTRGGFRHLVVLSDTDAPGTVAGIISVRDIVRVWSGRRSPGVSQLL